MTKPSYMTPDVYYFIALAMLVLTVIAARAFQRKRVGRNMIAVRDNPAQAAAMGVGIVRTKLTAFVFAGILAAAAGFLWSTGVTLADNSVFDPVRSLSIMAAVVIGGLGSVAGAIVGVFYLLAVPYFLGGLSSYVGLLASAIGVLALVLTLPGGLARLMYGARDWIALKVTS
jgi:branched-chain amino acid transport system permease protein